MWTPSPEDLHEHLGNSPHAWLTWVDTLAQAAKQLRQRRTPATLPDGEEVMIMSDAVCAMLLGYAFEFALKGLWVKQGNKIVSGGKLQKIPGGESHQLLRLAGKVGITATPEEFDALNRLTPFVRFAGRYPVSVNPEEMKPRVVRARGRTVPGFYSREDFDLARRLLNRLTTQLRFG